MFNTLTLRRGLLAVALTTAASLAYADATYQISLDTSSFSGSGWIDLQFNPGNLASTTAASVTLTDLVGFGDSSSAQINGAVSGSLATGYTISNTDAGGWNDLFHEVNYSGGTISFIVTFSGLADASQSSSQSVFSVSLLNSDATVYLGTTDAFGSLVALNYSAGLTDGSGTVAVTPLINTIPSSVTAVPEPSSWAMLAGGLALLGLARRRQQA